MSQWTALPLFFQTLSHTPHTHMHTLTSLTQLISEATEAFFGSTNTSFETLVKMKSRMLPLFFAPRRIRSAFQLHYRIMERVRPSFLRASASSASLRAISNNGDEVKAESTDTDTNREQHHDNLSDNDKDRSTSRSTSAKLRKMSVHQTVIRSLSHRANENRKVYYKPVPFVLMWLVFLPPVVFCLFVLVRLGMWDNACATPVYNDSFVVANSSSMFGGVGDNATIRAAKVHNTRGDCIVPTFNVFDFNNAVGTCTCKVRSVKMPYIYSGHPTLLVDFCQRHTV